MSWEILFVNDVGGELSLEGDSKNIGSHVLSCEKFAMMAVREKMGVPNLSQL